MDYDPAYGKYNRVLKEKTIVSRRNDEQETQPGLLCLHVIRLNIGNEFQLSVESCCSYSTPLSHTT